MPRGYTGAVIALPAQLRRSLEHRGRDLRMMVIRLGAMGDILRTIPPVRLLRAGLPEARIVWLVEDRWRLLLDEHPDLDELIVAPRRQWEPRLRSPGQWPALWRSLREFREGLRRLELDLVVDFHGNLRSGLLARWTGAPVRLGYAGHQQKEGNRWLMTHRVPSAARRTSRMERNLALVRALGVEDSPLPDGALPILAPGAAEAAEIERRLPATHHGFAVVSPGASVSQIYKRPPAEILAAACRVSARRGVTALVVYGPGEEADARAVVDLAGGDAVFAPPTKIPTLAALLARARLFVGGDTGPMHLACAVGCPVVALYGPTDPRVNEPWGVPFRVVAPVGRRYTGIKRQDRQAGGFEGIEAEQLERAVSQILDESPAS